MPWRDVTAQERLRPVAIHHEHPAQSCRLGEVGGPVPASARRPCARPEHRGPTRRGARPRRVWEGAPHRACPGRRGARRASRARRVASPSSRSNRASALATPSEFPAARCSSARPASGLSVAASRRPSSAVSRSPSGDGNNHLPSCSRVAWRRSRAPTYSPRSLNSSTPRLRAWTAASGRSRVSRTAALACSMRRWASSR